MKEKDVDDVVEEQILTIKLRTEDSSKKLMKYKLKITNSVNNDDILMLDDVIVIKEWELRRRDEDMPMLPPKPSMQMTHMELDECKETTLHDVNIEEEMRIKTRSSTRRLR
ncbi:hypothetical protein Tco_0898820 [Tanacetum coccineum]